MRLLTLRNRGAGPKRLRIAPFFDLALEDSPNASIDKIHDETVGSTLLFQNPRNDFVRGFAFAATSLEGPATETIRARFFGGPGRNILTPAMVETGASDGAARDDGRRVAAFSSEIVLPPGRRNKDRDRLRRGADPRGSARRRGARRRREPPRPNLQATRASWAERLGKVEVRTNRPDFDRLVNTWLPYQLYASRLFGRVGPNQLGGATGYRDQLQDVLPLTLLEPRLTRAQIVLHATQQFREGDVLKWWHRAPGGGTGLGQRTKASDPHLWLPYVLARYVRESGDRTVLDEVTPFLEAEAVPAQEETWIVIPRVSRESATVYEHARLAIAFTLEHMGANGLPLLARRRLERRHRRARPARNRDQRLDGLLPRQCARRLRPACAHERRRGFRRPVRGGARRSAQGARSRLARRPLPARLRRRRTRARLAQRDDHRLGRLFRRL